jgi:hypothetical protein
MILGVIVLVVALALALNTLVSIVVLRSRDTTAVQKALQLGLVWLVPVAGAVLVLLVYRADAEPRGPKTPPFGGGDNDGMPGGVQ